MAVFTVKDLFFNYQDKELYNNLSFQLNPNEHACLVGSNGCGKTTLLNIITKNITPDKGSVNWEGHISYAYLDQKLSTSLDSKVDDYLYGVFATYFHKEQEMNRLYENAAEIMKNSLVLLVDHVNQVIEEKNNDCSEESEEQ